MTSAVNELLLVAVDRDNERGDNDSAAAKWMVHNTAQSELRRTIS